MGASREHRQQLYERLVGQNVAGRYEITDLLGFGGMGAVYEATQQAMQRSVALKVIPAHDPTITARFEREAITVSQLQHPNTVTVFDYGQTDDGLLFLAMEMLSGYTLSDLIEQHSPLPAGQAVHIATQICRSLGEAHKCDIVHRDVKPDNIFLIEVDDDPNFVKVLDFGIAKIVRGEDNVELTGTGRIIGTPKYMSPEQILAEKIDHRSDIYSLGCIIFEMLCGTPPFAATSTTKLMLAHAHEAPPTFSERLPNDALSRIPGPIEQVVRRALSKSPSERQQSTDQLREELDEALEATGQMRIADLNASTQVHPQVQKSQTVTSTSTASSLDSSDLLSQHSSQTLAQLKPTDAPEEAERTEAAAPAEPDEGGGSSKAAIYGIVAVLLIIGGLLAYTIFQPPDDGAAGDAVAADQPAAANEASPASATPSTATEAAKAIGEMGKLKETGTAEEDLGSEPTATSVPVRLVSHPDNARVFLDGKFRGRTPFTLNAEPGETIAFHLEKEGYRGKDATFTVEEGVSEPQFAVELDQKPEAKRDKPTRRTRRRPTPKPKPKPTAEVEKAEKTSAESEGVAEQSDDKKPAGTKPNVGRLEDEPLVPKLD